MAPAIRLGPSRAFPIPKAVTDCAVCDRLTEDLDLAISRLVNATDKLSVAASRHQSNFDSLLQEFRIAKDDCERIRAERERHKANHNRLG